MASCSQCSTLKGIIKKKSDILRSKQHLLSVYKDLCDSANFKKLTTKKIDKSLQCCLEYEKNVENDALMYHVTQNKKLLKEIQELRDIVSDYERKLPSAEGQAKHLDFFTKQLVSYFKDNEITLKNLRRDLKLCAKATLKYEPKNSKAKALLELADNIGKRSITTFLKENAESLGDEKVNEFLSTFKNNFDSPTHSLYSESSGFASEGDSRTFNSHSSNDIKEGNRKLSKRPKNLKGSLPSVLSPTDSFTSHTDSLLDSEDDIDDSSMKSSILSSPCSKKNNETNILQLNHNSTENSKSCSKDESNTSEVICPSNSSFCQQNSSDPTNSEIENKTFQEFDFENLSQCNNFNDSILDQFLDNLGSDSTNYISINSNISVNEESTSGKKNQENTNKLLVSAQSDSYSTIFENQNSLSNFQTKSSVNSAVKSYSALDSDVSTNNLPNADKDNESNIQRGPAVESNHEDSLFFDMDKSDSSHVSLMDDSVNSDMPPKGDQSKQDQLNLNSVDEIHNVNETSVKHLPTELKDIVSEKTTLESFPNDVSSPSSSNISKDQQFSDTENQVSLKNLSRDSDFQKNPSKESLIDFAVVSKSSLCSDILTNDQGTMMSNKDLAENKKNDESAQSQVLFFENSSVLCENSIQKSFHSNPSAYSPGSSSKNESMNSSVNSSLIQQISNQSTTNEIEKSNFLPHCVSEISVKEPVKSTSSLFPDTPSFKPVSSEDLNLGKQRLSESTSSKICSIITKNSISNKIDLSSPGNTETVSSAVSTSYTQTKSVSEKNMNISQNSNIIRNACTYKKDDPAPNKFHQIITSKHIASEDVNHEISRNLDSKCTKVGENARLNIPTTNKILKSSDLLGKVVKEHFLNYKDASLTNFVSNLGSKKLQSPSPCREQSFDDFTRNHQYSGKKNSRRFRFPNSHAYPTFSSFKIYDSHQKPPGVKINSNLRFDSSTFEDSNYYLGMNKFLGDHFVKQEFLDKNYCCCEGCPIHFNTNKRFLSDDDLWKVPHNKRIKEVEKMKKPLIVPVFPLKRNRKIDIDSINSKLKKLSFEERCIKETHNLFSEAIKDLKLGKHQYKFPSIQTSKFTNSKDPIPCESETTQDFTYNNTESLVLRNMPSEKVEVRCEKLGSTTNLRHELSSNESNFNKKPFEMQNLEKNPSLFDPVSNIITDKLLQNQNKNNFSNSSNSSIPLLKPTTDVELPNALHSDNNMILKKPIANSIFDNSQPELTTNNMLHRSKKKQENVAHKNSNKADVHAPQTTVSTESSIFFKEKEISIRKKKTSSEKVEELSNVNKKSFEQAENLTGKSEAHKRTLTSSTHFGKDKISHKIFPKNSTNLIDTHIEKKSLKEEIQLTIPSPNQRNVICNKPIIDNSSLFKKNEDKFNTDIGSEKGSEVIDKLGCSKSEIKHVASIFSTPTLISSKNLKDKIDTHLECEKNMYIRNSNSVASSRTDITNSDMMSRLPENQSLTAFTEHEKEMESDNNTLNSCNSFEIGMEDEENPLVNEEHCVVVPALPDCVEINSHGVKDDSFSNIISKQSVTSYCKPTFNGNIDNTTNKILSSESYKKILQKNDDISANVIEEEPFPLSPPKKLRISHFSSMKNGNIQISNLTSKSSSIKNELKLKKSEKKNIDSTSLKSLDNVAIQDVPIMPGLRRVSKNRSSPIKCPSTKKNEAPLPALPTFKIPNEKLLKKKKRKGQDAQNLFNEEDLKILEGIFSYHRSVEMISPFPPSPGPRALNDVDKIKIAGSENSCSSLENNDLDKSVVPSKNEEFDLLFSESKDGCQDNVSISQKSELSFSSPTLSQNCGLLFLKEDENKKIITLQNVTNCVSTEEMVHSNTLDVLNNMEEPKHCTVTSGTSDENKFQKYPSLPVTTNNAEDYRSMEVNKLEKTEESISLHNSGNTQSFDKSSKTSLTHDDGTISKEVPSRLLPHNSHLFNDAVICGSLGDSITNLSKGNIHETFKSLDRNEFLDETNIISSSRKSDVNNYDLGFNKSDESIETKSKNYSKLNSEFYLNKSNNHVNDNPLYSTNYSFLNSNSEHQEKTVEDNSIISDNNKMIFKQNVQLCYENDSSRSDSLLTKHEKKVNKEQIFEKKQGILKSKSEYSIFLEQKENNEYDSPSSKTKVLNDTSNSHSIDKVDTHLKGSISENTESKIKGESITSTCATHKIPQLVPDYNKSLPNVQNLRKIRNFALTNDHFFEESSLKYEEKHLEVITSKTSQCENNKNTSLDENKEDTCHSDSGNKEAEFNQVDNLQNSRLQVYQGFYKDLSDVSEKENLEMDGNDEGSSSMASSIGNNAGFMVPTHFINTSPLNYRKKRRRSESETIVCDQFLGDHPENKKRKNSSVEEPNFLECSENIFCAALKYFMKNLPIENIEANTAKKDQNLEKELIKRYFLRVLGASAEDIFLVINRVVSSMKQNSSAIIKPKSFSRAAFDIISNENGSIVTEHPFMSKTVLSCTAFTVAYVGRKANEFLLEVLRDIEEILGAYYDKTLTMAMGIKLISYYTVLCKAYNLEIRAKHTMFDILYSRHSKAYGLIHMMLQIWPKLLVNQRRCIAEDCVLTQTIIYLLLNTAKDRRTYLKGNSDIFQKSYNSASLKTFLKTRYGYSHQTFDVEKTKLVEKALQRITMEGSKKALVLLSHLECPKWSISMVKSTMIPILRSWIDGKIDSSVALEVMITAGIIVRGLPALTSAAFVPEILNLFEEILHKSPDEYFVERAIEAIGFLRRHNIMMCALILMRFTPTSKTITENTMAFIRKILSAQDFSYWLNVLKKFQT